jgi:thioredoxin-related protein
MKFSRKIVSVLALMFAVLLAADVSQARVPDGWPFLEFNEAVKLAKQQGKPMFVYFGFETCPYCAYLNEHTLASPSLRKLYTANYVLAYFDIRGNPKDEITLPDGGTVTRGEAIKRLKGSPVPAWMFVDPDGRTVLMRRGSHTKVNEFWKYDLYVAGGAYRKATFEEFLAQRGLREDTAE